MSDFTNDDGKIRDFCETGLVSIIIFALNTFFIDRDFNAVGSKLQLSILAPIWHIDGTRRINLDGFQPSKLPPAKDGDVPAGRGSDGKPGLPGGPAGNFFGRANKNENAQFLTITANGGSGGSGQDGGKGGNGLNGENARNDDFWFEKKYYEQSTNIGVFYNRHTEVFIYSGKSGSAGGPGGNGGAGGNGGFSGRIDLFIVHKSADVPALQNNTGLEGRKGKGGFGGKGGATGNDLIVYDCKKFVLFIPFQLGLCDEKIRPSSETAPNGRNGMDGVHISKEALKVPENPPPFQNSSVISHDYHEYLQKHSNDRFKKHSFTSFLNYFNEDASESKD